VRSRPGLSFATYDTVDERSETQNGSAPVPVQVTVDPLGRTYSVQYGLLEPAVTEHPTYKEAWNLCNAPKPRNVDQTATRSLTPPRVRKQSRRNSIRSWRISRPLARNSTASSVTLAWSAIRRAPRAL
jgi:hypothetical protein